MILRRATSDDWPGIWRCLKPVFRAGTTYAIDRDISEEEAHNYWMTSSASSYVAQEDEILGTFYIRPNASGGGAHVCNCGYVTAEASRGKGLAEAMCRHSQDAARELGYKAMQFNMVLASNEGAVLLWHRLGFKTVGQVPKVFDHPDLGYVDGHVMFKWLDEC